MMNAPASNQAGRQRARESVSVIAIDGPTASGKGAVAAGVARALGFHLLDSGALYRLAALASLRHGIDPDDVGRLTALAASLDIVFHEDCVQLESEDVSRAIRAEEVSQRASAIAVHGSLRQALVAHQRAFRAPPGLVADGRDMGTVIFPDASLKVFLTASPQARAVRRYKQLIQKGFSANIENLLRDLRERDARDTQRAVAPLIAAPDACTLDTSTLTVAQAVERLVEWYRYVTDGGLAKESGR